MRFPKKKMETKVLKYELYVKTNAEEDYKYYKSYWNIGHAKAAIKYKLDMYRYRDNPYRNYIFQIRDLQTGKNIVTTRYRDLHPESAKD